MQTRPEITVVAAVIVNSQRQILITQRLSNSHLAGYWEFPGGKIREKETPPEALQREILEELGVTIEVGALLWQERFTYPEKHIHILFFCCRLTPENQAIRTLEVADYRWVNVQQLDAFQFPPADEAFIRKLKEDFNTLCFKPD